MALVDVGDGLVDQLGDVVDAYCPPRFAHLQFAAHRRGMKCGSLADRSVPTFSPAFPENFRNGEANWTRLRFTLSPTSASATIPRRCVLLWRLSSVCVCYRGLNRSRTEKKAPDHAASTGLAGDSKRGKTTGATRRAFGTVQSAVLNRSLCCGRT